MFLYNHRETCGLGRIVAMVPTVTALSHAIQALPPGVGSKSIVRHRYSKVISSF
jgi:hypothetical protein